jgi:hypothetical protein
MNDMDSWEVFLSKFNSLKLGNTDFLTWFQEVESLAQSCDVYVTQTIVDAINMMEGVDLISASGKQTHAGYRAELYDAIFIPLISLFPAVSLEYWYVCVVSAVKQVGISESDTSHCMSECFRSQEWSYDMQFAILLTQVYQLKEQSSEKLALNIQPQEELEIGLKVEVKIEPRVESKNKESQPIRDEIDDGYLLYAFGVKKLDISEKHSIYESLLVS